MAYHLNIEIKAKCTNQDSIRNILKAHDADFKGLDHQIDTYFNSRNGRLKLRESTIENGLIFYERQNDAGPKQSDIIIYFPKSPELKQILEKSLGIMKIVDKQREIYFIDNVKFHLDKVEGLGEFVEIEAIDSDGSIGRERLLEQCNHYMRLFNIKDEDLLTNSYSDMI